MFMQTQTKSKVLLLVTALYMKKFVTGGDGNNTRKTNCIVLMLDFVNGEKLSII